jgi:hypothetical protein
MNLGAAEKTSPPVSQVCEASGSSFFLPVRQALFRTLQQNCFPDRFTVGTGRKVFLNAAKKSPDRVTELRRQSSVPYGGRPGYKCFFALSRKNVTGFYNSDTTL